MFERSYGKISATVCRRIESVQFSPQSHKEIKDGIADCLRLSAAGDCSRGVDGPIGHWDVSAVMDMNESFAHATDFNADISKWDVSAATKMTGMFSNAKAFNADISRWDVSSVRDTNGMFSFAETFNVNISKWDVSAVTEMTNMFYHALSFDQVLCGY